MPFAASSFNVSVQSDDSLAELTELKMSLSGRLFSAGMMAILSEQNYNNANPSKHTPQRLLQVLYPGLFVCCGRIKAGSISICSSLGKQGSADAARDQLKTDH